MHLVDAPADHDRAIARLHDPDALDSDGEVLLHLLAEVLPRI
jgi:hypothetical protein